MSSKKCLLILSAAIASSTSYAQPPSDGLPLSLEPSAISFDQKQAETSSTPSGLQSPAKLERSILETSPLESTLIVSPLAESSQEKQHIAATVVGHEAKTADPVNLSVQARETVAGTAELIHQRFPNGKPQIERWVAEDAHGNLVNHGKYVEYDANGSVVATGIYELGKQVGEWTKVIALDQVQQLTNQVDKDFTAPFTSRAKFKNGTLDGDWTVSDARGNLLLVWTFQAGAREGQSTVFNSKSEIVFSINYKNNLADGPAKFQSNDSGKQDTQCTDGLTVRQVDQWYPAAKGKQRALKSQESQLVAVPYNVSNSNWNENKVDYRPTSAIEPIRHGMAVTFYENGQRESEGTYERGLRNGTFAWWYSNGQQRTVGEYRNDLEEGNWTWWHENGMKEARGLFAQGKRVDEWSLWNEQGKLVSRKVPLPSQNVAERPSAATTIRKR